MHPCVGDGGWPSFLLCFSIPHHSVGGPLFPEQTHGFLRRRRKGGIRLCIRGRKVYATHLHSRWLIRQGEINIGSLICVAFQECHSARTTMISAVRRVTS